MDLLLATQTLPFGVAAVMVVAITLIEFASLAVSGSPLSALDAMLADADPGGSASDSLLGWLHVGRVPLLVITLIFLGSFAVTGYTGQAIVHAAAGLYLPAFVAGGAALLPAAMSVRVFAPLLGRLVPHDETLAVSEATFVGRRGTVVTGCAERGRPARIRVADQYGHEHFVMAEPDLDAEALDEGTPVVLVSRSGAFWRCIRDPHGAIA